MGELSRRDRGGGADQAPHPGVVPEQVGVAHDGATVFRHACKLGFEGIVSKRLTAPYRSGPARDWLKVKNPDSPAMRRPRESLW
jgi:hypothetical protein